MTNDPHRYVSLAQIKAQLTIPAAETDRESQLDIVLASASARVEAYCGRVFTLDTSATARTFDPDRRIACRPGGAEVFLIDDIGSETGLIVESGYYTAGATYQTITDYATDRPSAITVGRPITGLLRAYGWYTGPSNRLRVTAKWGWPVVPEEVAEATLILAARLWRRKDTPEGTSGGSEWGTIRLSRFDPVSRLDPDVAGLLGHLAVPGFA